MMKFLMLLLATVAISFVQARTKSIESEMLFFDNNTSCQNDTLCSKVDLQALNTHLTSLCKELVQENMGYKNIGTCMAFQRSAYNKIQNSKTSYSKITAGEFDLQHEYHEAYMRAFDHCKLAYKIGSKTGDYGYKAVDDCVEKEINKQ